MNFHDFIHNLVTTWWTPQFTHLHDTSSNMIKKVRISFQQLLKIKWFWSCSDQNGNAHLPFARLRLKPVNRMSCVLEVESGRHQAPGELILSNKLNSRAGLAITSSALSGGQSVRNNNKISSLCYLCLEPASLQVKYGDVSRMLNVKTEIVLRR